jgi:hypothetical protein
VAVLVDDLDRCGEATAIAIGEVIKLYHDDVLGVVIQLEPTAQAARRQTGSRSRSPSCWPG